MVVRSRTSGAAIAWASVMPLTVDGTPSQSVHGNALGTRARTQTSSCAAARRRGASSSTEFCLTHWFADIASNVLQKHKYYVTAKVVVFGDLEMLRQFSRCRPILHASILTIGLQHTQMIDMSL